MQDYDVIIPLFNGERWIDDAIHSVMNQNHQPKRIIVVNDGSTDSSVERASRFQRVQVFHNPKPGSAARAKNYGLQRAQAPLVAFLDQDDVWHPRHIELLNEALMDHPDIPAAASFFQFFRDDSPPRFDLTDRKIEMIDPWSFYPFAEFMEPSLILFRRSVFEKFTWSDRVPGFADRYLWLQLSVHYPLIRLHVSSVAKRVHSGCQYRSMFRDPVTNLRHWAEVSDALLSYRSQHAKETPPILQRRRSIVPCLGHILKSLVEREEAPLQQAARTLESLLSEEKTRIQAQTFETLGHFIDGIQETIYHVHEPLRLYEFMHAAWPRECRVTGTLFVRKIVRDRPGLRFYLRHISRNAFKARCYALFLTAIRYRWNGAGDYSAPAMTFMSDNTLGRRNKYVQFISAWGERGPEPNQFLHCEFLALDAHGHLLVSDADQAVIKVFTLDGDLVTQFGGRGDGEHQFVEPEGVSADRAGNVFVSDSTTGLIKKFAKDYTLLLTFGGHGREEGKTKHSEAMAVSREGLLYVADANNHRISAYDLEGRPAFTFGCMGSGRGQFNGPQSCKIDSKGNVWVTDFFNHRIQVFTPKGKFLESFGKEGNGPLELRCPTGLALDNQDRTYVCDMGNHRIQVFDRQGNFLFMFGRKGRGAGEFGAILDVAVNDKGDLFVTDCGNHRIQRFKVKDF